MRLAPFYDTGQLCVQRMDQEQAARDATVAQRQARLEAAYRRGGGDALCASLVEQARKDAERAAAQAAAREAADAAAVQKKRAEAAARTKEQIACLDQQVRFRHHRR